MAITITGIDYDYLSPDAVHICKDAMHTPFDGCITTFAEVRCIKYGAPALSTGHAAVSISWDGGTWYGFSQGLKSAPADPDRYNEYTVTCMDAMGYLNNIACKEGNVYSFSSFANYIYAMTGISVDVPFESAYFSIEHLMPSDDEESDSTSDDFPTFGHILQELGKALGVVFCADTSVAGKVTYTSNNGVGTPATPKFPGTQIGVNDSYSMVTGRWNFSADRFPSFEIYSESHVTGHKIDYESPQKWDKYEGKYITQYTGAEPTAWAAFADGQIAKITYSDDMELGQHVNETESPYYIKGFAISKRVLLAGSFTLSCEVFVNPMYNSSDPHSDIPLLWHQSAQEVANGDLSCVYLHADGIAVNPGGVTRPRDIPSSGWMTVNYHFDVSNLSLEQLMNLQIVVNSRYTQAGGYPTSESGGGRGLSFVRSIKLFDGEMKKGVVIKKNAGSMGKSFNIDTSFFAPSNSQKAWIPGIILGAGTSTEDVMTVMANRLKNQLCEKRVVIASSSLPDASSGCKSFDLDVAKSQLTITHFTT